MYHLPLALELHYPPCCSGSVFVVCVEFELSLHSWRSVAWVTAFKDQVILNLARLLLVPWELCLFTLRQQTPLEAGSASPSPQMRVPRLTLPLWDTGTTLAYLDGKAAEKAEWA